MTRYTSWLRGLPLLALAGAVVAVRPAPAAEVGFVEDFALAGDRAAALKQLIPGTDEHYYFHCLHLLNAGQFDKADELATAWAGRRNHTPPGLTEIRTRHALLTYDKDPKKTLQFVRDRLSLRFDHQKEVVGTAPDLPTALDPALISRARLAADAIRRWRNYDNFEDVALEWAAAEKLDWPARRQLLARLQRPDVPGLPKLVADDLNVPGNAQSFGAYPIHRQMTLAQLDALAALKPDVVNQAHFVNAYLVRLQPGADDDWKRDRTLTRAYLDRLHAFVDRLPPVHNSLKAHVFFHRLAFDRAEGVYDRGRFLAYLQLPRQQGLISHAWLNREECRRWPADLSVDFTAATLLPRVGADEPLVRSYFQHFFADAADVRGFDEYVDHGVMRHLLAETKLVNGTGDADAWAAMLPPEQLRALKERVDIDFAFTNRTEFAVDEPVKVELFVKNAPTLLVKVYEVNTRHFYRTHGREVDTDINLDGLVPNAERVIAGNPDPFRRTAVTVELPDAKNGLAVPPVGRPGVYVVDFIGAGKSSRALIRKGRLHAVTTTGTAGQVVRVFDEKHRPVNDATVYLGGQEYKAEKDGAVVVPFSTSPGRRPAVLARGDFACLHPLEHQPEVFALTAGIHVDRESLLTQRVAPVLVRPGLTLNGQPVSVKLLEDVRLRVTSTDLDGVPSSVEVPDFKLFEDRESVHEVRVPPRLAALQVSLTARVKTLSTGKTGDLIAEQRFALNGIARSVKIENLHLARFGADYVLELLGRTGEARADRAVRVQLKHREFKESVIAYLKSDANGRVTLGPLPDITTVTATDSEGTNQTWPLVPDRHTHRGVVHAKAGEVVSLPYLGTAGKPDRGEVALFELRGDAVKADVFDAVHVENGRLRLRGLAAGDYDLVLKHTGEKIRVRVAAGDVVAGHLLGNVRHLQLPGLKPVQIETVTADADAVVVRLTDASRFARVHVFATRYVPAFRAFDNLARVRDGELEGLTPGHAESIYLTGRNIGDEYRYVLERRGQKKFPGNMLERPGLLLNPWAVRTTETGEQLAQAGQAFGGRAEGQTDMKKLIKEGGGNATTNDPAAWGAMGGMPPRDGDLADLDFLYDAAAVAVNLVPDKDGIVKLSRKEVGPHALLHVVAVDPLHTTCRAVSLPEQPARFADLRLHRGLDPNRHFTQQKQVTVAEAGKPFVIEDAAGSRFEAYDSLAKVYGLYATLSKDPKLAEFAFVLRWPTLKPEEKRELYSKHACHELNYFLSKKDPAFFNSVVKPYTANKKDKTFLDHWLLGDDVSRFLQPWEHGRLNVVERALLARRTPGEPVRTARHLDDMLRLLPPETEKTAFLFNVAVAGGSLKTRGISDPMLRDPTGRGMEQRNGTASNLPVLDSAIVSGASGPANASGAVPAAPPSPPAAARPAVVNLPQAMKAQEEYSRRDGRTADKKGEAKDRAEREALEKDADGKPTDDLAMKLGEETYFENDRQRVVKRQLFRKLDPTVEYAENNYYKLPIAQQTAALIGVSPFWADFAAHTGDGPFLSRHLPTAGRNFTEMMFALSALDLPFEPAKHEVTYDAGRMTLTPGGRLIAFHEEVRPAAGAGGQVPILVSQNFYRPTDRFREENGERVDKFVTDEFVVHTVYGCQVVVTNPTSSRQRLSVLVQVPVGAVPLAGAKYTRSLDVDLEPYRTQTIDYRFYFPRAGTFHHFPVHVAKNEQYLASAPATAFNVVDKPSKLDTGSWDYVSQHGTDADVIGFLARENVRALNLDKMAFRLRDRVFFETAVRLLQDRHLYHPTTYSYGVYHADPSSARQFLLHQDALVAECGGPIESPLLAVDPVARHQYEHLEYKPLVNARAHSLGRRRQIVNDAFHAQYHRFLKTLTYRTALTDADLLAVTYYLLLQDRVDEAMDTFARVSKEKVPTAMQYDYCAAYLALFAGKPHVARSIAVNHVQHPVDRWRNTFAAVIAQVDEIEGRGPKVVDAEDRGQAQGALAATEPALEVKAAGDGVTVTYQNLDTVRLNYYLMDVELLFSTNPFVARGGGRFASVRPTATAEVVLPKGRPTHTVPMPPEFDGKNVLVEATAGGLTRSVSHLATTMTVAVTEPYGALRVTDAAAAQPVAKAYVKVYAKLADGSVKFHKDGYTDLRGRFDYVSVNTPERQPVERFAVLVLSDDRGAVIREAAPPQR